MNVKIIQLKHSYLNINLYTSTKFSIYTGYSHKRKIGWNTAIWCQNICKYIYIIKEKKEKNQTQPNYIRKVVNSDSVQFTKSSLMAFILKLSLNYFQRIWRFSCIMSHDFCH